MFFTEIDFLAGGAQGLAQRLLLAVRQLGQAHVENLRVALEIKNTALKGLSFRLYRGARELMGGKVASLGRVWNRVFSTQEKTIR